MDNDRHHSRLQQHGKYPSSRFGDGGVRKFDEQVLEVVDCVPGGVVESILNRLKREVKLAAVVDCRNRSHGIAKFGEFLYNGLRVEGESGIAVRRGDQVRRASFGGHRNHSDRFLKSSGTVIQAGQNVSVNINHDPMPGC
jgi:hypothetical protein